MNKRVEEDGEEEGEDDGEDEVEVGGGDAEVGAFTISGYFSFDLLLPHTLITLFRPRPTSCFCLFFFFSGRSGRHWKPNEISQIGIFRRDASIVCHEGQVQAQAQKTQEERSKRRSRNLAGGDEKLTALQQLTLGHTDNPLKGEFVHRSFSN